ncbi:serine/threonine protein kinase [Chitinophaga oryziterrae]|nr:protein kinase [Chitinophaga oryziterrae]
MAEELICSDYTQIVESYGIGFSTNDYYLIADGVPETTDWLIELSIVLPQIEELLKVVLPMAKSLGVPFSMAKNDESAVHILYGNMGYQNLNKVITFYPSGKEQTIQFSQKLVAVTAGFNGPKIPTAAPLGSIVYTEYIGSVPFEKSMWPFPIKMPVPKSEFKKIFSGKYMIVDVLKQDIKGDVFKGIYIKGFLKVGKCVIKQGRQYMWTDFGNRDMSHRLQWQKKVQEDLYDSLNIPKVIDLFTTDGNNYLVMEFIEGQHLEKVLTETYKKDKLWKDLSMEQRNKLLNALIQIIESIEVLHKKGYVHRDIKPANFILDNKGRLFLIDLEITYHKPTDYPNPAFGDGTLGFMSPEQLERITPTEHEDIYGFGGLMVYFFTGQPPADFDYKHLDKLKKELSRHIENQQIRNIIMECYQVELGQRPSLQKIKSVVQNFQKAMLNTR